MIKLFRKIRQELITKGKLGKYIFYAIGEIFLVVIGILLALYINNRNIESQDRSKEQVYLKSLKVEFERNLELLDVEIERNERNRDAVIKIANAMDDESIKINNQALSGLIATGFATDIEYKPRIVVLNELISSGSMKDISNPELKDKLAEWQSLLEKTKGQERLLIQERINALDRISDLASLRGVFDDIGYSTTAMGLNKGKRKFNNLDLLRSIAFENRVLLFIATSKSSERDNYLPMSDNMKDVLELLSSEIISE